MELLAMAADNLPYAGPIVTRAQAKAAGLTKYFTGNPCPRGHIAERWVASWICDVCQKIDQRRRHKENIHGRRDKMRVRLQALQARGPNPKSLGKARYEKRKAYVQAWVKANRKRLNAYHRARHANASEEELERKRAHVRNRRAKERAGGKHSPKEILELLRQQGFRCAECRVSIRSGYHADHIMPLSRGGTNDIRNIQLLCQPCNQSKFAKHPLDWAREQGRLL